MTTVDKALALLDLFSEARPALGLSEAARLLDRDKASVARYLAALARQGLVEQDPDSRLYHLGPAVVRLALVREATWPVDRALRGVLEALVAETQETAHLTQFSGGAMSQVAIVETAYRGTRVYIDPAERLPLHATATGLAFLSALAPERRAALLAGPLVRHTALTPASAGVVLARAEAARAAGWAESPGTFEIDVGGIAAPVFDAAGRPTGAVAVAAPLSRITPETRPRLIAAVTAAAREISRRLGGPPRAAAA